MKKTYRNVVLAGAIAAFTAGCGGTAEEGSFEPDINPEYLEGPNKSFLMQDIAYLFGDIFKQLLGTLDMTANTTGTFTDSESTLGQLIGDALDQSSSEDTASGISLNLTSPCSKGGDFDLGVHFQDETNNTPAQGDNDFIRAFSETRVDTSIRANFKDCEEYSRNPVVADPADPDARLDTATFTSLQGLMDVTFVSFPNAAKTGFELVASIKLDEFSISGDTDDIKDQGVIRFDGSFDVSLKSDDTSDNTNIPFLANIGANYVNRNSEKFAKISIDANGSLNTNDSFNEFTYNLDFKGSTINHNVGIQTFEYFATSNLIKTTKDSGFNPDSGELMIITPDGDAGTATIRKDGNTIQVDIDFDGQKTTCSFDDLLAGSDNCAKPAA